MLFQLGRAIPKVRRIVDQGLDLGVFQHVRLIFGGPEGMERSAARTDNQVRAQVVEHLGTIRGQDRGARALADALRFQRLREAARPLAHLRIGDDGISEEQKGTLVVAVEAVDDEMGQQGHVEKSFIHRLCSLFRARNVSR